jgi:hypothetical protein
MAISKQEVRAPGRDHKNWKFYLIVGDDFYSLRVEPPACEAMTKIHTVNRENATRLRKLAKEKYGITLNI